LGRKRPVIIAAYVRMFFAWVWRCSRAWIEIGHRVRGLEETLSTRLAEHARVDEELRAALVDAVASAKLERDRIHERIDRLDRTQQLRIDEWAQQVSSQINQVYIAVAASQVREG
jgi:hypothetical protein